MKNPYKLYIYKYSIGFKVVVLKLLVLLQHLQLETPMTALRRVRMLLLRVPSFSRILAPSSA